MANQSKLAALRKAVLGNGRGREATVSADGQVELDSNQDSENQTGQKETQGKGSKMSPVVFAEC